jgi:2-isopropylmalate synthase
MANRRPARGSKQRETDDRQAIGPAERRHHRSRLSASSPEDFVAVQLISTEIEDRPSAPSRAPWRATSRPAARRCQGETDRIHTGIGVSDIHIMGKFRDEKYGTTLEEKRATRANGYRRRKTRSFLHRRCRVLCGGCRPRRAGVPVRDAPGSHRCRATVVNIPDTTGYTVPEQFGALIRSITENVPNVSRATISVHCHDDLGLAVANSLAGVANGARQVEGTINGVGERAGNAALEEVVMAIRTRGDYFRVATGINTTEFCRTSRLVADMLGMAVPPNKAVVGGNAFSHSSGIHVDGFLKQRETYEIMRPEDVGFSDSRVVLTARTGRHGLRDRLEKLGYALAGRTRPDVSALPSPGRQEQEVFDEPRRDSSRRDPPGSGDLPAQYLHIYSGTSAIPTATVRLRVRGDLREGAAVGDGPVDAACKAISQVAGSSANLVRYEIRAVTSGTEAMGEVTVNLEAAGRRVMGRGASTDVIEASARAFVDGLNKLAGFAG